MSTLLLVLIADRTDSTYQKLAHHVLTRMHRMKIPVTDTQLSEYTVRKSEQIFLTQQQQWVMNIEPWRAIFTSDFGTGKTLLLRAKAVKLAKSKHPHNQPKIVFVIFLEEGSLLVTDIKKFTANNQNISVLFLPSGE